MSLRDPSGNIPVETTFDLISAGASFLTFMSDPTWGNFGYLIVDGVAVAAPYIPGSYALKAASKVDDVADGTKLLDKSSDVAKGGIDEKVLSKAKPVQLHHFASNKSSKYTPQFQKIADKYGLDLNEKWNKDFLEHIGRHPNAYHDYVLDNMKNYDEIAQGDREIFLKLYDNMKKVIKENPNMLQKEYWK